jgi:hypothetical protein
MCVIYIRKFLYKKEALDQIMKIDSCIYNRHEITHYSQQFA